LLLLRLPVPRRDANASRLQGRSREAPRTLSAHYERLRNRARVGRESF